MNINFESDVPFEEDKWNWIKINNSEFKFVIECGRCKLTTLNRQTLEYEKEPLRSLKVSVFLANSRLRNFIIYFFLIISRNIEWVQSTYLQMRLSLDVI